MMNDSLMMDLQSDLESAYRALERAVQRGEATHVAAEEVLTCERRIAKLLQEQGEPVRPMPAMPDRIRMLQNVADAANRARGVAS